MTENLEIKLTTKNIFFYTLPVILSSLFANVYGLVDSIFVANLVGIEALSAVNIVSPFLSISLAVGTMLGTGGSAIVAKLLGEGKEKQARSNFTLFFIVGMAISVFFLAVGLIFEKPILFLLGADESVYSYCKDYALPIFISVPFMMASIIFQIFLTADGNPGLAFLLSILGGVVNIVFDYVWIKPLNLSVAGAAIATGMGYGLQTLIGFCYFTFNRKSPLRFSRTKFDGKVLLHGLSNGSSEMVSMLAVSITMIAMNNIVMRIIGTNGIAAATVVLSAQSLFSAFFVGYAEGVAPLIGYNYGKTNYDGLKQIFKSAIKTIAVISAITLIISFPLARPISKIFSDGIKSVENLAVNGIFVSSAAFAIMGFNVFASSIFTAYGDGKTSAILALFRTFVFLIIPLVSLPFVFGIWGVWISLPLAEICSIILSIYFFKKKKALYHYI